MKIIIFGINGMIGSSIFNELFKNVELDVLGTVRETKLKSFFFKKQKDKIVQFKDLTKIDNFLCTHKPDLVINCIGVTKHRSEIKNIQNTIYTNSIFPHNLNEVCDLYNIRLIHISTDCIFSGKKGQYENYDNSDSEDLYGKSKALGEIDNTKALTIRTSTIGHELSTSHGLLEWFLSQTKECRGYKNAIFSGLTNIELSRVIINYIIPDKTITGIYNIGGKAIDKFSLLAILNKYYKKNVKIKPDYNFIINRSLNSSIFYKKTGYNPPNWEKQVEEMYKSNVARKI